MRVGSAAALAVATVIAVGLALAFHAANDDDEEPGLRTPSDQALSAPPATAQPVKGSLEIGHIERALGPEPDVSEDRILEELHCEGDLITVRTDREILYARMPCQRFVPTEIVEALVGLPTAVVVVASETGRLKILTTGGSAEFTVEDVWLERR